jgi:chromosome segregation ATPase
MTIEELKDWKDDVRNELERDLEQVREKHEQISNYLRVLDAVDEMVTEHKSLKRQLDDKQDEIDNLKDEIDKVQSDNDVLRQQLLDEKERRLSSQTKLSELSKLSAGVAKKSSQDELIKAMRSYLNISRRKTQGKREAAKMVFMEMFTSAKLELPDDIMESLDHLDDDQDDPKVVNVTGSYNDIHDNSSVYLKE